MLALMKVLILQSPRALRHLILDNSTSVLHTIGSTVIIITFFHAQHHIDRGTPVVPDEKSRELPSR